MQDLSPQTKFPSIFSRVYWKEAAHELSKTRTLVFAALIIALRVAVKLLKVPIAENLYLTLDCYVNAVGSLVYGPVVGLLVGAVSDTLGCIIAPIGPYFFPFIFVEMSSSFIFALFFWKRNFSVYRVLLSKFTVNMVCNIILNSLIMKWNYKIMYGAEKAYPLINSVRIAKNLILFPLEAMLICVILGALISPMKQLKLIPASQEALEFRKKHVVTILLLTALSIGLVLLYVFFLRDFIAAHNIKLL